MFLSSKPNLVTKNTTSSSDEREARHKTERGERKESRGKGQKRDKQPETRRASTYRVSGNRDGEVGPSTKCRADSAWGRQAPEPQA